MKNVITLNNINKKYVIYNRPIDRLYAMAPWNKKKSLGKEYWALKDINLEVTKGEVIGIVGRNGAGKSTLLQIICNTLKPSSGDVVVNGKISALLELGSGFNHEFSGRENVYLSAAIAGMSKLDIDAKYNEIVEFSEIGDYIDQPVKTYSSGMIMRLAFSVATSVSPDILVIDEALSVGDGAFARKSFDRIMSLKDMGATIFFCSHSLFHIESLCARALWINGGVINFDGPAADAVSKYQEFLDKSVLGEAVHTEQAQVKQHDNKAARLESVRVEIDGLNPRDVNAISGESTIKICCGFVSDVRLAAPNVAITIHAMDGRTVSSAATWEDGFCVPVNADGKGYVAILFRNIRLLKGEYLVSAHLLCEKGVYLYDSADGVAKITVKQKGTLQGYFEMEHQWESI